MFLKMSFKIDNVILDPDLDPSPDPNWAKIPDPNSMYLDPRFHNTDFYVDIFVCCCKFLFREENNFPASLSLAGYLASRGSSSGCPAGAWWAQACRCREEDQGGGAAAVGLDSGTRNPRGAHHAGQWWYTTLPGRFGALSSCSSSQETPPRSRVW